MSAFSPGSVPWLLAHELRLTWRGAMRPKGSRGGQIAMWCIGVGVLVLLAVTAGAPLGLVLRKLHPQPTTAVLLGLDMGLLLLWTLMLSQTLSQATVAFYERADLDLLLSSPLPVRRILAVRTLAIAATVLQLVLVLATPFLLPVGLIANLGWLAAYVVIGCLSLLASVAGVWLAMALFALLGPRRTRTVAQVLAALAGAVIFLISQSYNLMGRGRTAGFIHDVTELARSGRFHADSWIASPARAALGSAIDLVAFVVVSLVLFAGTAMLLGRRFGANAAAATGSADPVPAAKDQRDNVRFTGGPFAVLVRKEMRLLGRDPALLSQVLLQMLYLAPLAFVMVRNAHDHAVVALATGAGGVVFLSAQLAGSLGWITISGEEAPELLGCAPITPFRAQQAKVAAVLIPVFLLLLVPLLALAAFNAWAAAVALAFAMVASIGTCLIELWRQRPGKRSEFRRRRGSSVLVPLIEVAVGLFLGLAAGLAVAGLIVWAAIPLLLGLAVVWAAKPRSKAR